MKKCYWKMLHSISDEIIPRSDKTFLTMKKCYWKILSKNFITRSHKVILCKEIMFFLG